MVSIALISNYAMLILKMSNFQNETRWILMLDLIEYAKSMNGYSFEKQVLTEADALILAQMAYFDYTLLKQNSPLYFTDITEDALIKKMVVGTWNMEKNRLLLKELVVNPRYQTIEIIRPIDITDKEEEQQFSAVTFKLTEDLFCISYRGTRSTFIGWKENLNMSYLESLPSQLSAIEYFKQSIADYPGDYYLVGHSKGGNLAEYVGVYSEQGIKQIYNFDGPGLLIKNKSVAVDNRVKKIVPTSSVIGVLFEINHNFEIAESNRMGILQHDLFSWKIGEKGEIISNTQLSWTALYTQRVTWKLLTTLDLETKQTFLDSLYKIATELDSPYLVEGLKPGIKNIETIFHGLKNTDKEVQENWKMVFKMIIRTSIQEGFQNRNQTYR